MQINGVSGAAVTQGVSITGSIIEDNQIGVSLTHVSLANINHTEFGEALGTYTIGLQVLDCPRVNVRHSSFENIDHAAISVHYANHVMLYNTNISSCDFGVYDESIDNSNYSSNIYMMDGTIISDCRIGIYLIGGIYEGLVYMDCAKLWNNEVGITGTDITLAIDAKIHALATDGTIRPNSFKYASGGSYFDICYFKKWHDLGSGIPASNNYWYDEPSFNYPGQDYFIRKSRSPSEFTCSYSSSVLVNLLYTPVITTEPTMCIARMISKHDPERTVPFGFGDLDCQQVVYLDTTKVVGVYSAGISSFYLEDFDDAEAYLGQVAASAIDTTSDFCSEYIRISRSMSPPALLERPASTIEHEISAYSVKSDEFTVSPIPFDDLLQLSTQGLSGQVIIFDMTGKVKHSFSVQEKNSNIEIGTREWSSGFYFLKMISSDGETTSRKILKNK